jgi:hypothetical protein
VIELGQSTEREDTSVELTANVVRTPPQPYPTAVAATSSSRSPRRRDRGSLAGPGGGRTARPHAVPGHAATLVMPAAGAGSRRGIEDPLDNGPIAAQPAPDLRG